MPHISLYAHTLTEFFGGYRARGNRSYGFRLIPRPSKGLRSMGKIYRLFSSCLITEGFHGEVCCKFINTRVCNRRDFRMNSNFSAPSFDRGIFTVLIIL